MKPKDTHPVLLLVTDKLILMTRLFMYGLWQLVSQQALTMEEQMDTCDMPTDSLPHDQAQSGEEKKMCS